MSIAEFFRVFKRRLCYASVLCLEVLDRNRLCDLRKVDAYSLLALQIAFCFLLFSAKSRE